MTNKELACQKCTDLWLRSAARHLEDEQFFIDFAVEKCTVDPNKTVRPDSRGYLQATFPDMRHPDTVLDVIEIYHPMMAVVTACHDEKIRIISTQLKRIIGILDTGHQTGIRQLDYTPFHGASLLSVGYESFFNLWEMDNSLSFGKTSQDTPNKFSLVSSPVVAARFMGSSVFVASIDTMYTVKIWNYKEQQCLQSL